MDLWFLAICGLSVVSAVVALAAARVLRLEQRLLSIFGGFCVDHALLVEELGRCATIARASGPGALTLRTPGVRHPLLSRGAPMVASMAEAGAIRRELDAMVNQLLRTHAKRSAAARLVSIVAPAAAIGALTIGAALWLQTLEDPTTTAGGLAVAVLALYACGAVLQALASAGAAAPGAATISLSSTIVIEGLVAIREGQDGPMVTERLSRLLTGEQAPSEQRRAA